MRWRPSLSANRHHTRLAILALIGLLWANLPYLVGVLAADQAHLFSGFVIFEQDGFSYLADMRQGMEGEWLFHLPFTTEAHQPALLFPVYILLGKFAGITGLSLISVYHAARLFGSILAIWMADRFIMLFVNSHRWQLATWLLLLFTGGSGWLAALLTPGYIPFEAMAPDAFLFSVLYGPPHVAIALGLLLWLLTEFLRLFPRVGKQSWPRVILLSVAALGLAGARPSYSVVLFCILGVYLVALAWRRKTLPGREALVVFSTGSVVLPYLIYLQVVFTTNPAMAAWRTQNAFDTPTVLNVLTSLGPLLVMAGAGVLLGKRWREPPNLLVTAWLAALPIMLYLPLPLQRRFLGGAHIALALVVGYLIDHHLLPWLRRLRTHRTAYYLSAGGLGLCILILVSYPLAFSLSASGFVASQPDSLFLSPGEWRGLNWLAELGDQPVALSAERAGNRIPAFSSAVPVLGHPMQTLDIRSKRAQVVQFFDANLEPADRDAIIAKYGVDLIWFGPAERELGAFDPAENPAYGLLFEHQDVQIWSANLRNMQTDL